MANKRSSKKDLRRSTKRKASNAGMRSALKTHIKKVRIAVKDGNGEAAREGLVVAASALDKAVQRGIIHKNQAARRKSRIAKAAHAALSGASAPVHAAEPRAPKASKAKAPAKAAPKTATKAQATKPKATPKAKKEA